MGFQDQFAEPARAAALVAADGSVPGAIVALLGAAPEDPAIGTEAYYTTIPHTTLSTLILKVLYLLIGAPNGGARPPRKDTRGARV